MPERFEFGAAEAAMFLQGYVAACRWRLPKWLRPHVTTSSLIVSGKGASNPLDVYEMIEAARVLRRRGIDAGWNRVRRMTGG